MEKIVLRLTTPEFRERGDLHTTTRTAPARPKSRTTASVEFPDRGTHPLATG
jgi:hypothetical protein